MNRKTVFISVLMALALTACSWGEKQPTNEKRYPIKGIVVAVNKTEYTATIKHEDIPGYMPGMTMEFKIKNTADIQTMKPGDQITGTLVVDDISSWIEVTAIAEGGPALTPTTVVPGEPKPGDEIPDFTLNNQDEKPIRLSQYKGKALALTFVYTRCPQPDQCTLMSNNFAAIDQELQKQPDVYAKTHLLTISFDPAYDTPKVMRSYGASHTGRYSAENFQHWEFATGSADEVKRIAEFFGLRYFKDSSTGEDQVMHSLRTAVIDADGKLVKLYRGNEWKPAEITEDLKSLAANAH
ncbi:MAG TPA: SCO family protein [Pyrinomonadaceae bacterium]|nr:SCO family protein [Pyrinomonadaceae bacterium]